MAQLSRRHVLVLGVGGAFSAAALRNVAASEGPAEAHGISAFGDLKYPADFHHFDYVNPAAPKGGAFSLIPSVRSYNQSYFTFSSLNAYILKGEGAQGMDMTFAPLMVRANDEPDAMYGLVAKSVRISPDKLAYTFTIRPEARFHDGSKLTAHDVAFSLNVLKEKGHPLIVVQLRDFVKAEALDDATAVVTFAPNRARDVPLYVASLPIFSKAYYATRAFDESTLDTPLGSGPYIVEEIKPGEMLRLKRRKDFWAEDHALTRGLFNACLLYTRSAGSRSTVTSNMIASRIGGAPICRSAAAATISTRCATSSIATATSPSKASPARTICSARSSPRASGRRATISRR